MRVHPLDSKLYDNIRSKLRKIDKQLPQKVLADKVTPSTIDSLIVLGDGREDYVVVPLICYHLNGKKITAIVKPTYTRYGAIQTLKTIVKNYKTIAFILDQESDDLSTLYDKIKEKLIEIGVQYEIIDKSVIGRLIRYECILLDHWFKFVVIINGLDDVVSPSHKIEDHLVRLVRLTDITVQGDSKDAWNDLSEKERLEVFRSIYSGGSVVKEVFKQHFEGLGLLDC
jgi:hypothetical protein